MSQPAKGIPGKTSKGASRSETMRVAILGVAALIILGVIAHSLISSATTKSEVDERPVIVPDDLKAEEDGYVWVENADGTKTRVKIRNDGEEIKTGPFEDVQGALDAVQDGSVEFIPDAYHYAIHKVAATPQAEIEKQSKTVSFPDLKVHASRFRGTYIKMYGSLLSLEPKLFEENRSGIRKHFRVQVVANNREVYTFVCFQVPEGLRLRDVVEIHGLFYKFWSFYNKAGQVKTTPYFIARTFKKVPPVPPTEPIVIFGVPLKLGDHVVTAWEVLAVGLLLLFAPALFFLVRYERRKFSEFKQEMMEKKKKKRATLPGKRKGTQDAFPPEGPAPSDSAGACGETQASPSPPPESLGVGGDGPASEDSPPPPPLPPPANSQAPPGPPAQPEGQEAAPGVDSPPPGG